MAPDIREERGERRSFSADAPGDDAAECEASNATNRPHDWAEFRNPYPAPETRRCIDAMQCPESQGHRKVALCFFGAAGRLPGS